MRKLFATLLFILAPIFGLGAAPPDMFSVRSVPAFHEARSAAEARPVAIARANASALRIVLERLLPTEVAAEVQIPPTAQLERMIRQFEIEGERMGDRSYSANISVQFDGPQISEWLRNQGLSPLASELPPILLFIAPEFIEIAEHEVANRASSAVPDVRFRASSPADLTLTRALPLLELQDELTATGTANAAVLELSGREGNFSIRLTDRASGKVLSLESRDNLQNTIRTALTMTADFQKLFIAARGPGDSIMAILYFSSFEDWLRRERTITSLVDVADIRLVAMMFDRAQIDIRYRNSIDSLTAALAREGIRVENRTNYLVMR